MSYQNLSSEQFYPVQENSPLPARVAEQLRSMIVDGTLEPGTRLSNEMELAKALSVSRSTLRAALDRLVRDGLIVRRRGVGTFVTTQHPVLTNLNINLGATSLIRSSGATPGIAELVVLQEPAADDRVIQRLELEHGSPIIIVERVRTANDRRVIFAREFMPAGLLLSRGYGVSPAELEQFLWTENSLHEFFRRRCGLEVHHGIARLQPATADAVIAGKLEVSLGSLLMYLEQVDYDTDGRPLLLSDEYWVANAFTFSVYRTS